MFSRDVGSRYGRGVAHWLLAVLATWFVWFHAQEASADTLDDVLARGELRWGGDQEGGGPFVYPREDGSGEVTGFEVELAAAVARELGVAARFEQGNWDKLPDLLRIGKIDVVLNGYELTPERAAELAASRAYYVYALQLLVHGDAGLGAATLARPTDPKRKLGVLLGSAAETHARKKYGDVLEIVTYDGNTDAMREVVNEKLDATLQDTPIVAFYGRDFPQLLRVGRPEAEGRYVMYARREDTRFVHAIDVALTKLHRSGELRAIYERWGIWDDAQEGLRDVYRDDPAPPPERGAGSAPSPRDRPARPRGLEVVVTHGGVLLASAGMTVLLALLSFPLAVLLGALVAIARTEGPRALRVLATVYVEVLRGTPLLLQLYVLFFLLPEWGVRLPALATAVVGLGLNYSAYEAEIFRAGILGVPRGQTEAAYVLGLSRAQTLRHVVLPQATRLVLPPMANDFIALFKDTSVCSVITIVELTKRYSVLSMSTQATLELTIATAALYLAMSLPASALARHVERRFGGRSRGGVHG